MSLTENNCVAKIQKDPLEIRTTAFMGKYWLTNSKNVSH